MSRTLRINDQGADVRAVQDVLNFQIRRLQPLVVDAIYGAKTQARVMEFQRANGLSVDGIVGLATAGKLFETELVPFALLIAPKLQLTLPTLGGGGQGIKPPQLVSPLTLPGLPVPQPFQLLPSSFSRLPTLTPQGQVLTMKLSVPARNDPLDPAVRSFRQIVQLLDTLPQNFPFRASIIGAVPNPVKKPGSFDFGFKWGIAPVFDLKKLASPTEFSVGAKANASYTFGLVNRGATGLKIGLFAKGDFKGELDWTSEKATSRPLLQLEGSILIGVGGLF